MCLISRLVQFERFLSMDINSDTIGIKGVFFRLDSLPVWWSDKQTSFTANEKELLQKPLNEWSQQVLKEKK